MYLTEICWTVWFELWHIPAVNQLVRRNRCADCSWLNEKRYQLYRFTAKAVESQWTCQMVPWVLRHVRRDISREATPQTVPCHWHETIGYVLLVFYDNRRSRKEQNSCSLSTVGGFNLFVIFLLLQWDVLSEIALWEHLYILHARGTGWLHEVVHYQTSRACVLTL